MVLAGFATGGLSLYPPAHLESHDFHRLLRSKVFGITPWEYTH